ncbi:lipopolysaccharide biosynthesis protein [Microbacterium schleiferi]|uniref:Lipopolysaccharide biosynthesis protein n=2 Tax=Microbacterium schleiferi TaxID=69362 RepID=A0A7S8RIH2_9MICO|nr:lipopolysaccharide biosynthesis protein [Microbacterium schleiferi]
MVVAIIGLGEILRDFGLGSAAVQARELTRSQRDNLFWINTGLGALVGLTVALIAPLIAQFYGEPRLTSVAQVLAVGFLLNGMTAQYRANLSRDLRFGMVTLSDVVPAALALATAAVLAAFGFGYWALVAQQLAQATFGLVMSAAFGRWIPGRPRRTPGMGGFIRYGSNLFGVAVLNYLTRNVDSVVVGAQFGATQLGFYNRAYELVTHSINRVNLPLTRVAVPVLAKLQDDDTRHRDYLVTGQKVLLLVTLPLLGVGGALAYPLIAIVLGNDWLGSAPIVQILAVGAAADVAAYAVHWYALSKGLTDVYLRINLALAPVRIAGILVGALWGTLGVAAGFTLGSIVMWIVALIWMGRAAAAPSSALFFAALRSMCLNGAAALAAYFGVRALAIGNVWLEVAVGIGVYALVWSALVFAIRPLRRDVVQATSVRRYFRS